MFVPSRLRGAVAGTALFLALSPHTSASATEQIEVEGDPSTPVRPTRDSLVGGAVIPRADLRAPGVRVGDVLRSQAGVQITDLGGRAPTTISIRGAPAAQTLVYLGGTRLNDEVGGAADLSLVPLWIVRRVEIYRGHAPFDADRFAIGGAVFFEPRRISETSAGGGATVGSYGSRAGHVWVGTGNEGAGVLAGVQLEHVDNDYPFEDSHGVLLLPGRADRSKLRNADVTTRDAWLLGSLRVRSAEITFLANAMAREQGAPTLALVPARAARASHMRGLLGVHASLPVTGALTLDVSHAASSADARFDDPLGELAFAARSVGTRGGRAQQRLGFAFRPSSALRVRTAIDASSERLERDDDGRPALRVGRLSTRLSSAALVSAGRGLSVASHFAVTCETHASQSCDDPAPEGRLGLALGSKWWEAFVNVGRYARAPTLGERFGIAPLVRGNPMLRPETGTVVDVGLRLHGPRVFAALVGFARRADDLVGFVRSSQGFVVPQNIHAARVVGLEVQAGVRPIRGLTLDGTATWLDPRDISPDRRTANDVLAFQSRLVVAPRIAAETRLSGWLGRVRAEARYVHQSSRFADAAGLAVIPAQGSLDADLLAEAWEGRCTFRVRVSNALDARRVDVVGFPLPGRSFFASLEVHS